MAGPSLGLKKVPTAALQTILKQLHRGELECPVSPVAIALMGLQDYSEPIMGVLRGLDDKGVRAVMVVVLAERAS